MQVATTNKQPDMPILEVCVESFGDAVAAARAGADRIEYCSALALGGLTPTVGALARIRDVPAPCMVMIRPRPGGFCYDPGEVAIMKDEIAAARDFGAAGVVFGACDADGHLDHRVLSKLMAQCDGLQTTLHRVFDEVPDPSRALSDAIAMGFDRILTSGGKPDAQSGMHEIAKLIADADGKIGILPGAGVNATNAADILRVTGAVELHSSCKAVGGIDGPNPGRTAVDVMLLDQLRKAMANVVNT